MKAGGWGLASWSRRRPPSRRDSGGEGPQRTGSLPEAAGATNPDRVGSRRSDRGTSRQSMSNGANRGPGGPPDDFREDGGANGSVA